MADDKVLDRIQKLIALSASPEEEEARTSALMACRLILEHRLIVVRHTNSKSVEDHKTTWWEDMGFDPETVQFRNRRPAPPRPPPRPPRPTVTLRIVVMCEALCSVCGQKVGLSEEAWLHGSSVIHLGCKQ